ncbi:MAG: methylated-DNA--[protein]-cysteine S-methyltransferase [Deltaproteobacteria bacterium]|nr:MAG: methylated-DNA--[protein]-cysteine S-methyltransferase [Deltaproteobacteria bacterium]
MSPFARKVLGVLAGVPYGQVVTYGRLAEMAGRAGAARAVGMVMSKNPLPIVWPCHRVVSASGLGGFSAGLSVKRRLLELEGAA